MFGNYEEHVNASHMDNVTVPFYDHTVYAYDVISSHFYTVTK